MAPFPNLVSESLLVNSTIDYLISLGGRAPASSVVDFVMNISRPDPTLAKMLIADVVNRDPRLAFADDEDVQVIGGDHAEIDLRKTSFVVFDLETTGAKAPPCRITEIGACRVADGRIVEEFNTLVNPGVPIPPFITSLTGISDEMVADAPAFADIAADFLDFIGDSILIAHNARFDMGFLNHEIGRIYEDYRVGNPSLCTVNLSRRLLPDIENHKLKTIANHYEIALVNHHRAGDDARATAEIFINLLEMMLSRGMKSFGAARSFSFNRSYVRRLRITT